MTTRSANTRRTCGSSYLRTASDHVHVAIVRRVNFWWMRVRPCAHNLMMSLEGYCKRASEYRMPE